MKDFFFFTIASSRNLKDAQVDRNASTLCESIDGDRIVTAKRCIAACTARNLFGRRRKNARSTLQLNQSPLLPSFPPFLYPVSSV